MGLECVFLLTALPHKSGQKSLRVFCLLEQSFSNLGKREEMGSYCPKRLNGMEKGHIGQMDHRAYFQYSKSFISSHTWELEHTQAGGRPKTFPQKTLFHLTTPFASSIGIADFKVHFPPWLFERISLKSHNPLSEFCPSASWTSLSDSHGVFVHCCQHPRWCLRSLILSALLDVH